MTALKIDFFFFKMIGLLVRLVAGTNFQSSSDETDQVFVLCKCQYSFK